MKVFPVVILAGGLGTRLGDISKKVPKSMVLLDKKPFLHYQLKYLNLQGVKRVIICLGYLGKQIEDFFGNGAKYNLEIIYSPEGDQKLGTGGALLNAKNLLPDYFFLMYGDSFLPISFQDVQSFFLQNSCLALMTVMNNANKWDKSNVVLRQNNLIFYDKFNTDLEMNYIDYGLSLLSKKTLLFYKFNKKFDLSKFYNSLSIDKFLHGYVVKKRFYEIGSIIGLDETRKFLKNYFR